MADGGRFNLNNPREVSERYTNEEIRRFGLKEAMDTYNRQHRATDGSTITEEQVTAHYTEEEIHSFGLQVVWNQEWRNYCISDTYEPGSPSKIFTVAAAMEEGIISSEDIFYCDGYQEVGDHKIKCTAYNKGGHQNVNVAESLIVSCNDAMMQIAAKTGVTRFTKYMDMFGFGKRTGIDLPGEADTKGLIYTAQNMGPTDLATSSFGQTYNCSMIQMAAAYSSVINGGSYYEPHVVKQILNDQGSVVKKVEPKLVRETVSESTSNFICNALLRTVDEGTGKAAAVVGYDIAGKTGTAQKIPRHEKNYVVSFCGFAPANDPQVLVYVVIDVPHVAEQAHSSYASSVFQKIMSDILPYLNVFPAVDFAAEQGGALEQLPAEEGIAGNAGIVPETEPETEAETRVYETDEYIDSQDESNLPERLPETSEEGSAAE